jgi:predicted transcriptional regulator
VSSTTIGVPVAVQPRISAVPAAFTISLEDTILEDLDRLAEKTDRSRASLVTEAVQDYIALNAWQLEKIEAGIAAADRGEFASEDEVERVRRKYSQPQ